jgi:hypothetical protein
MKIFKITFDCICITASAKDESDLFGLLIEEDDNFFIKNKKLMYSFGSIDVECDVELIECKRQIIQWESH